MDMWLHTANNQMSIRVSRQLFSAMSEYQKIEIFESPEYGRLLALDGDVIFSMADEFIYNEMVVHVPMSVHPNVKKVLIIGGGDGGVAREFTAYPEIERIDVVEPDEMFVHVCREYFPEASRGFEDPRVNIIHRDGLRFLRGIYSQYDIIINDSTDPFGHTEGLFTKEFYGSCYRALKADGIMVYQHGSPFFDEDETPPSVPCTARYTKVFRLAESIRPIYQPVLQDIGHSALHRKSITPSSTLTPHAGMPEASKPGITPPTCTWVPLCFPAMWKNCWKKRKRARKRSLKKPFKSHHFTKLLHTENMNSGGTIMSKLLIIGCGGVASVAIHKCCQNSAVFTDICIASRTISKCNALKAELEGKTTTRITTAQIDAEDVPAHLPLSYRNISPTRF